MEPIAVARTPTRVKLARLGVVVVIVASLAHATAASAATSGDEARYAREILAGIDAYRAERGLAALAADATLSGLASAHSVDMARVHRLSHDGFRERFARSGHAMCVENVGWNYATSSAQLHAWKVSPGHNRNLLDRRVTVAGVGVRDRYVTFIACE